MLSTYLFLVTQTHTFNRFPKWAILQRLVRLSVPSLICSGYYINKHTNKTNNNNSNNNNKKQTNKYFFTRITYGFIGREERIHVEIKSWHKRENKKLSTTKKRYTEQRNKVDLQCIHSNLNDYLTPLPPKANGSFSQISKYRLPACT